MLQQFKFQPQQEAAQAEIGGVDIDQRRAANMRADDLIGARDVIPADALDGWGHAEPR
jgi:hypothetical protein